MQDKRIEKLAAVAINITKVLLIIYLGFEEVFKIINALQKFLDTELDKSRKWASQNYSILKTTSGAKSSGRCRKLVSALFLEVILKVKYKAFLNREVEN